jgi:hypothetical protein
MASRFARQFLDEPPQESRLACKYRLTPPAQPIHGPTPGSLLASATGTFTVIAVALSMVILIGHVVMLG